jgi:asparagine synthetase B (glutamine-hydrolysing)
MQNLFSNSTSNSVCYKDMMNSNESNLKTYLDNLKRSSKNANRLSFYFKMAVYLKHETVDNIFEKFSSLFKSMTNNNLTITFNGEIYNYNALREELKNEWKFNTQFLVETII